MTHPTLEKLPKSYLNWFNREVQKEDWHRWAKESPINQIPKYEKTELKFTKVSAFVFGKQIIKYILI